MSIFKDKTLNKEFLEQGFVKIQLLTKQECKVIKKTTRKLITDPFYNKSDFASLPHPETSEEISSFINNFFKKIIDDKIKNILVDEFNLFYSSLLVKKRKSSSLIWHVDPSFYNQKQHQIPINIWAGIDKTTHRSGCLRVVPKSHKLAFDFEPLPLSQLGTTARCKSIKEEYTKLINKHAIDVPLKLGEVIIHDQSLLHASHPNKSLFKKRIAYKIIYIPNNVKKLQFAYFNKANNDMDIYEIDRFMRSSNLATYFHSKNTDLLFKDNQLIKNTKLNPKNLPFTTLKEMEKIMETPKNDIKAVFELT